MEKLKECTIEDILKHVKDLRHKLDEYEKTGLTPEQIVQIDKAYADKCVELAKLKSKRLPEDVEETIYQLESLHAHCMSMSDKKEEGEVWQEDCKALEAAISTIRQQGSRTNRRMRVYISGKVSGTDDYMERFADAERQLIAQGYQTVNPAKVIASISDDLPYEECMQICMHLMDICDAVYMMDGWGSSLGATGSMDTRLRVEWTSFKKSGNLRGQEEAMQQGRRRA